MDTDFIERIRYLISLKTEGDYWDFKQEWHEENETLLHDILNFANTKHDRDCYLIIGVSDDGEIIGLNEDKQKEQANIIDILRNCKFAGDNIPLVKLEKVNIEGKSLDILVILNSDSVPYYLKETNKKHKKIKAANIYIRVGDTNTPISENASVPNIEALWKKRFGIHLTGLKRFSVLLNNPNDWSETDKGYYNIYYPEYTIENGGYENRNPAFYSYVMENEYSTGYEIIYLKYHGTLLKQYDTAILDSGQFRTVCPNNEHLVYGKGREFIKDYISYRYFISNELASKINTLFLGNRSQETLYAKQSFDEVILLFNSANEKDLFEEFVIHNLGNFKRKLFDRKNDYSKTKNEYEKSLIAIGKVLNNMLDEFRQNQIQF
ncbi:helix-turn-helix domain-containing protein [Bacillus subtilis]